MERPNLYVLARLLEALARAPAPVRKTQLQLMAGLNYTVFAKYLEFLIGREMVEVAPDPGGEVLRLTPKGYDIYCFLADGIARILTGK
ncbi:MAG: winged helix-turn-helix domain-containing protein [Thermoplasmata archaeon]